MPRTRKQLKEKITSLQLKAEVSSTTAYLKAQPLGNMMMTRALHRGQRQILFHNIYADMERP